MAIRKAKRTGKYRGRRRQGGGNVKNRRGKGNRGGKGMAGLKKHKKSWVIKYDPEHFGVHGFVNPNGSETMAVNLYQIERMIVHGSLEEKNGRHQLEFMGKILGTGSLSKPVSIRALSWSRKAEEKVKKAGGEITNIKPAEKKGQ